MSKLRKTELLAQLGEPLPLPYRVKTEDTFEPRRRVRSKGSGLSLAWLNDPELPESLSRPESSAPPRRELSIPKVRSELSQRQTSHTRKVSPFTEPGRWRQASVVTNAVEQTAVLPRDEKHHQVIDNIHRQLDELEHKFEAADLPRLEIISETLNNLLESRESITQQLEQASVSRVYRARYVLAVGLILLLVMALSGYARYFSYEYCYYCC